MGIGCRSRVQKIHKVGKIHEAIDPGEDDAHGSEPRPDHEIVDVVDVKTEFRIMLALDPSQRVRSLEAALVYCVEGAEVMSEKQGVGDVQVGLAGGTGEVIVAPRVL